MGGHPIVINTHILTCQVGSTKRTHLCIDPTEKLCSNQNRIPGNLPTLAKQPAAPITVFWGGTRSWSHKLCWIKQLSLTKILVNMLVPRASSLPKVLQNIVAAMFPLVPMQFKAKVYGEHQTPIQCKMHLRCLLNIGDHSMKSTNPF